MSGYFCDSFNLFILCSNPIVPCEEIKKVNLEAWQASTEQPDILTRTNNWLKNKVGSSGNSTK